MNDKLTTVSKKIEFKLETIHTKEFATVDEVSIDYKDIILKTAIGIKVDKDEHIVGIETKFTFTCNESIFIILNNECGFLIGKKHFQSFKDKSGGSYTIPKEFLTYKKEQNTRKRLGLRPT